MLYVGRLQTAHGTRITHRRDARLEKPAVGGVLGKWARGKTEPTDKLTLLSGSIASGESRTRLGWLPSALQHSILLILNPTLPSGPQDSPGQPPEASKRRSGRRSRQLTLSRRPGRRFLKRGPSVSSLEAGERAAGPALFLRSVLPALDPKVT